MGGLNMAEKYVVSILRKNQIDKENYVFNYRQCAIGEIDENNIFTSTNGKKYNTISRVKFLQSAGQPYGFSNVVKASDLMLVMGVETSFEDAIREYDDYFRRIITFIQIREGDIPYLAHFDYRTLVTMDSEDVTEEAYEDVTEEGMVPVGPEFIKDGEYEVEMKSSSAMFKADHCVLTVNGDEMFVTLYMTSESYLYMFAGTANEAAVASESEYIPLEPSDQDGFNQFVLPL